jgi:hypothetical protein
MRTYQVYTANGAGEIVGSPEEFLASDDVAATEQAQATQSVCGIVGGLPPSEAMEP